MRSGHDVIEAARTWIGAPYRHQGRSKLGLDCIGLVIVVAHELDLIPAGFVPPFNYTRRPRDGALELAFNTYCVPLETPEAGAVVLMRWERRAPPSHCGILTPENLIHAYGGNEKVVEHGFRGKWPARVHSFWRFAGVTPE
jgi:cell wall-associated NlpC family hydrolase